MEGGLGRSDFFDFVFQSASGILSAMDAYANLPVPDEARPRLAELAALLREWNSKVNLVSRPDATHLESRHLAACLAPLRFLKFKGPASVLDVGTGGGLPGLPLAICYPHTKFLLVDSIGKKTRAVEDMARRLGLKNVEARQARAELLTGQFDFVLGRAVTALPVLVSWIRARVRPGEGHSLPNGLLCWKGGDLTAELAALGVEPRQRFFLEAFFQDEYFREKYILHFAAEDLARARPPEIEGNP
jgi:16S rRNA (guanine527-N7)-methyltransferase